MSKVFKKTPKQIEATKLVSSKVHTLLAGGSRSGKSALAVYLTFLRAAKCPNSRHCICRQTFNDAVTKLGLDTVPAVLRLAFKELPYTLDRSKWYYTLPNLSEVWLSGLDDTGDRDARILGAEYSTIVYDECDQMAYSSILLARTRLAQRNTLYNREIYCCNPPSQSHWLYRLFIEKKDPQDKRPLRNPDDYGYLQINPKHNIQNIDPNYLKQLENLPKAQRDRFLEGLWTNDSMTTIFDRDWFQYVLHIPKIDQIVISVDPAGTHNRGSDATGICVCGKTKDKGYVIHSEEIKASPEKWGQRVVDLYYKYQANSVIVETNYGGDLVASNIHNVDKAIKVREVRASKGKSVRAEPISALYEQGLIFHIGDQQDLEDELMRFDILNPPKPSPNIADACVWGLSYLLGQNLPSLNAARLKIGENESTNNRRNRRNVLRNKKRRESITGGF